MSSLWCNTSESFLLNFLINGEIKSNRKRKISLSKIPDSGGQDAIDSLKLQKGLILSITKLIA